MSLTFAYTPRSDAEQDWIDRRSGGEVQWFQAFEADADVNNWRFSSGIGWDEAPDPGSIGSYVRRNPTEGILGRGALEIEQSTVENVNSYWWRCFNPAIEHYQFEECGAGRGPGQEFWVQLRVKGTHFAMGTGGGRKIFEFARNQGTSILQKLVWEDTLFKGVFQMYQGMNAEATANAGLYIAMPGADFNYQPGSEFAEAPGYCSYNAVNLDDRSNCWVLENNVWVTYLFNIVPATDGESDGRITVSAWKAGMPGYVKILERTDLYMEYEPGLPFDLNALACWIYETTGTSGLPAKQWFDQIIYSHAFIPCPTV